MMTMLIACLAFFVVVRVLETTYVESTRRRGLDQRLVRRHRQRLGREMKNALPRVLWWR